MVYTIEQIRRMIAHVVQKYRLPAVYLFGSYARGTATENSDLDFLIDTTGTEITLLIRLGELYGNLEDLFQKPADVITVRSLQDPASSVETEFRETVMRERVRIGGVVWQNENSAYASSDI